MWSEERSELLSAACVTRKHAVGGRARSMSRRERRAHRERLRREVHVVHLEH